MSLSFNLEFLKLVPLFSCTEVQSILNNVAFGNTTLKLYRFLSL